MRIQSFALAGASLLALAAPLAAQAQTTAVKPAPIAQLTRAVDIPFQSLTLKNGLRVYVHTDRKAPVVAVSVWYDVGAKHEPAGKTGFAHLFEHLMFNGSENAPGEFFEPLKNVGATDSNGTTNEDRTNYFETVPKGALERALFLESDRMGYLLGAITQPVLDEQRGVVQNEKRQGDNQPYGLFRYAITEGLYTPDHPYGHDTIGSMADLDAASLEDVKNWFRSHYGPNNAVLVLAGDVDVATARPLVEKYFGKIARGPQTTTRVAQPTTLAAPRTIELKDRVAATLITRNWSVPGLNDPGMTALDVAAGVLAGMSSARLTDELVRKEKLFVQVSASNQSQAQVGTFMVLGVVRPGVDAAQAGRRLDELVAQFLREGPTQDEVRRYVTSAVANRLRGFESVGGFGGKAVTLASGALFSNDPAYYKKELTALAGQTPASVKAEANRWLGRPALTVTVSPGDRGAYAEAKVPPKVDVKEAPAMAAKGTRGALPDVTDLATFTFPNVQRDRLSNGIELIYAQRTAVPVTNAIVSFDAGTAADVAGKLGTQQLTVGMLDEGTTTRDSTAIARAREELGAEFGSSSSADRTTVTLSVPSANLAPAADLFADVIRNPAFADSEVARVRTSQLAGIAQELTNPDGIANRVVPQYLWGPASPYTKSGAGGGDPRAVAALTPADLRAFQQAWLRPDKAKIFITSDRPLAEVKQVLEVEFGDWRATGAAGTKAFAAPAAATAVSKIVLVNRPGSPQSLIVGALPTVLDGGADALPYTVGNDGLGGGFLGRINMNLREEKHWSYGGSASYVRNRNGVAYTLRAPVQADQTGPSLAEMRRELNEYVTTRPQTQAEFDRGVIGAIRSLPGQYETSFALLGAMAGNDLYGRPDDYQARLPQLYRSLTVDQTRAAVKASLVPAGTTWVVVGEAAKVKPQLDSLGLPIEVIEAASVAGQ